MPRGDKEHEQYVRTVGEDGFGLLALLDAPTAPPALGGLPQVAAHGLVAAFRAQGFAP